MILPFAQIEPSATDAASAVEALRGAVVYEFGRLARFDDPRWFWAGLAAAVVVAILLLVWSYRRESAFLAPRYRWLLPLLRLVAYAGVVFYFLGLEKRVDERRVTDSQVVVLVDTSQSMSIEDETFGGEEKLSRLAAIRRALEASPLVAALRGRHDVVLASFDDQRHPLVEWPRRKSENTAEETPVDWLKHLMPQGQETHLGDALAESLDSATGKPTAGVIVLSDGGQNTGADPTGVAEQAAESAVPLYTVGVGSTRPRQNVRVQQLTAPARVFPDDHTTVSVVVHGEGFAGRSVRVELLARQSNAAGAPAAQIAQEQIRFSEQAEQVPVEFDIEPKKVGPLVLELRIVAPPEDQYAADNRREVEIEVVESQTRVLLLASAATRDYRFLRNQLRRDRHATVDVLLQNALQGISQDADQILSEFPRTADALYPYDCIVAFDADWNLFDAEQIDLLERWVAEEAGGLILVAGPVQTPDWLRNPALDKIRALYPVEFQRRLTLLDDGQYGSKTPWPLAFSRDGLASAFLWLADTALESESRWDEFAGVYGCYAVRGPKPGATVLARYSDPEAGISAERPVYLAEQFYGGGRVFYMGSGEMWRLRTVDPAYFEILYTRLIRHVSEGRLLRGSSRGRLLVERDRYTLGENVVVRAQLTTESREPLLLPRVAAQIVDPTGDQQSLSLVADEGQPGNFLGQFVARSEGAYAIELPVPDSVEAPLVRRIQVVAPNLEFDNTRRNERLLAEIANRTGGKYYASLAAAVEGTQNLPALGTAIESRAEEKIIRGTPDPKFTENLNRVLLTVISGALCLEWLLRRWQRLA